MIGIMGFCIIIFFIALGLSSGRNYEERPAETIEEQTVAQSIQKTDEGHNMDNESMKGIEEITFKFVKTTIKYIPILIMITIIVEIVLTRRRWRW